MSPSVGRGAQTFAAGAAISLNWIRNDVEAYIRNADVNANSDVTVAASDNPEIDSAGRWRCRVWKCRRGGCNFL